MASLPKLTKGSELLIRDLERMRDRARAGEYDDFASPHATPKIRLNKDLMDMARLTREGKYD